MIPWTLLGKAKMPGNGVELSLYQRDTEFSIKIGIYELMNSRAHESEDALARLACQRIANHPRARVLIGGLGMGYTVRSALDGLGPEAQVVVAELVPSVVRWNRDFLAELADSPLEDSRVTVNEADVAEMIERAKGDYNAILLDVDNGPQALTQKENNWLYSLEGLHSSYEALRPKGVLSIWASDPEPAFTQRLRKTGFEVDQVGVRARKGIKGGAHYIVWLAKRN